MNPLVLLPSPNPPGYVAQLVLMMIVVHNCSNTFLTKKKKRNKTDSKFINWIKKRKHMWNNRKNYVLLIELIKKVNFMLEKLRINVSHSFWKAEIRGNVNFQLGMGKKKWFCDECSKNVSKWKFSTKIKRKKPDQDKSIQCSVINLNHGKIDIE